MSFFWLILPGSSQVSSKISLQGFKILFLESAPALTEGNIFINEVSSKVFATFGGYKFLGQIGIGIFRG